MNIDAPIRAQSIGWISQLAKNHPVYRVDFEEGSLVIKAESISNTRWVKDPIEIMNVIDPAAKTRVIDKQELMALRNWVQVHPEDVEEDNPGNLVTLITEALKPPMPGPRGPMLMKTCTFIVMGVKRDLMDLQGAADKRILGNKSDVKKIAKALNEPGTLEKLGEIIAADAFNGNNDRINFDATLTGATFNGQQLECLQNVGNFFFGMEGDQVVAMGLDSLDPTNQFKDMDTFQSAIESSFSYSGTILRQDAANQRRVLAMKIVSDFETVLGPRNRKIAFARKERLPKDAPQRIQRGIESGAQKIQSHLKSRFGGRPTSADFAMRLQALGWQL
jgi:hypothetical protein